MHKGNSSNYDELLGFLDERDPAQKDNNITPAEGLLVDALAVKGTLLTVGGFLITIGLATFFLSTCGWLGACKQNTCLLFVVSKTAHHWPTKPHLHRMGLNECQLVCMAGRPEIQLRKLAAFISFPIIYCKL